jgi:hypothetical protein
MGHYGQKAISRAQSHAICCRLYRRVSLVFFLLVDRGMVIEYNARDGLSSTAPKGVAEALGAQEDAAEAVGNGKEGK